MFHINQSLFFKNHNQPFWGRQKIVTTDVLINNLPTTEHIREPHGSCLSQESTFLIPIYIYIYNKNKKLGITTHNIIMYTAKNKEIENPKGMESSDFKLTPKYYLK